MPLNLGNYKSLAKQGVVDFWAGRSSALENDEEKTQGGERAGVLGGKNMDGFLAMVSMLVKKNGLPNAAIHVSSRPQLTLPGYFRPRKLWDVLVKDGERLVAAIEFKSHVGPSFGNNFNNRAEEAIGTACDLATGIREGLLASQPRPFLGWLILVEDCAKSRKPVRDVSPHFPVQAAFKGASYLNRYDILCQRLMQESLYSRAAVLPSPREAISTGDYGEMSEQTSLHSFAAGLAGHVATWTA